MNLIEMMATMHLGLRVRAPGEIFYADAGVTIEEGRQGAVQLVTHSGALVGVQWDGDELVARATSVDSVEAVS